VTEYLLHFLSTSFLLTETVKQSKFHALNTSTN